MSFLTHEKPPEASLNSIEYVVNTLEKLNTLTGSENNPCVNACLGCLLQDLHGSDLFSRVYGDNENVQVSVSKKNQSLVDCVMWDFSCNNIIFRPSSDSCIRKVTVNSNPPLLSEIVYSNDTNGILDFCLSKNMNDLDKVDLSNVKLLMGHDISLLFPNAKLDFIDFLDSFPREDGITKMTTALCFTTLCEVGRLRDEMSSLPNHTLGTVLRFECKARRQSTVQLTGVYVHVYTPITQNIENTTFVNSIKRHLVTTLTNTREESVKPDDMRIRKIKIPTFKIKSLHRDYNYDDVIHYTNIEHCYPYEGSQFYQEPEGLYDDIPTIINSPFWLFVIKENIVISAAFVNKNNLRCITQALYTQPDSLLQKSSILYDIPARRSRSTYLPYDTTKGKSQLLSLSKSDYSTIYETIYNREIVPEQQQQHVSEELHPINAIEASTVSENPQIEVAPILPRRNLTSEERKRKTRLTRNISKTVK